MNSCMIAYEGSWVNTRGNTCSCSGKAEVVDHLIPISSNRVRKELGVKPLPGKKVESQEIGSAHISNLILACAACNSRKLQSFDRETIHRVIGFSPWSILLVKLLKRVGGFHEFTVTGEEGIWPPFTNNDFQEGNPAQEGMKTPNRTGRYGQAAKKVGIP